MNRQALAKLVPLAAIVLAIGLALDAAGNFPYQFGIDFYHLWGVGLAHETVPGNPYSATPEYARALNAISESSDSRRLHVVNRFRRAIEPTGTPLFYAAFGVLPRDYDRAYALHVIVLFAAVIASVYALGRLRGLGRAAAVALGLGVAATFNPFVQDVKFGNVNALQLAFVVGTIVACGRRVDARYPWAGLAYLPALALFVAFKPNTALIAAFLAAQYALTRGLRRAAAGAGAAVVALALAYGVGAAYFHDAGVWRDWYRYTQGLNGGTLLYDLAGGNQSLAKMMAERSGAFGPFGYSALLAAGMVVLAVAALTSLGKRVDGLGAALRGLLEDPWCAASLGVLFTLAAAPLVWPHYLVWALVPILWLFRAEGRWDAATAWTALAYVALSRPLMGTLYEAGWSGAVQLLLLLGWVPLVAAMYARLAARGLQGRAAGASETARQSGASHSKR